MNKKLLILSISIISQMFFSKAIAYDSLSNNKPENIEVCNNTNQKIYMYGTFKFLGSYLLPEQCNKNILDNYSMCIMSKCRLHIKLDDVNKITLKINKFYKSEYIYGWEIYDDNGKRISQSNYNDPLGIGLFYDTNHTPNLYAGIEPTKHTSKFYVGYKPDQKEQYKEAIKKAIKNGWNIRDGIDGSKDSNPNHPYIIATCPQDLEMIGHEGYRDYEGYRKTTENPTNSLTQILHLGTEDHLGTRDDKHDNSVFNKNFDGTEVIVANFQPTSSSFDPNYNTNILCGNPDEWIKN